MSNQNSPSKISFVYYEKDRSPRFFEVKKRTLRFYIFGLPLISFISVITLSGVLLYFNHIRTLVKVREPKIISDLKLENITLEKKYSELIDQNTVLQNKLTSTDVPSINNLSLFKSIPGQKDFSLTPGLSIEEINLVEKDNGLTVNFNLVNVTLGEKITGYLFVILKTGNQLFVFPKDGFPQDEMQLYFNKGESFTTSRFRPSLAEFPIPKKDEKILLKFLIFSRSGDLMLKATSSHTIGQGTNTP